MFGKVEEVIVVVLIILLLFGSKKIPELARSIGQSVKEVKKGFNGEDVDDKASQKSNTKTKSEKDKA